MWVTLVLVGVGLFSVLSIVFIVVRKFPQLSMVDVDSMPAEKTARKKKEILQDRVSRKMTELGKKMSTTVSGQAKKANSWVTDAQARLSEMEKTYERAVPRKKKKQEKQETTKEKVARLLDEADRLVELGDTTTAEEKLIEAISWEAKTERAYRGLSDLYVKAKKHDQALETLGFLYKMSKREQGCHHGKAEGECPAPAAVHVDLAELAAEVGEIALVVKDLELAKKYFVRAVSMAPMNPKYLDLLLDVYLQLGEVLTARDVLVKLKAANPDNKKISSFEERLQDLENKV
jgi:tetratricopeptide (TPR) repeat protein